MRGTVSQNVSFVTLVALTTIAFFALLLDFLMPVFWAAVLATIFHPRRHRPRHRGLLPRRLGHVRRGVLAAAAGRRRSDRRR